MRPPGCPPTLSASMPVSKGARAWSRVAIESACSRCSPPNVPPPRSRNCSTKAADSPRMRRAHWRCRRRYQASKRAPGKALSFIGRQSTIYLVPGPRSHHRRAIVDVTERDPAFAQIVGGKLQRNLVTGDDLDVVLAHLPSAVRDQIVAVVERDSIARVRQHVDHDAVHFQKWFLGH